MTKVTWIWIYYLNFVSIQVEVTWIQIVPMRKQLEFKKCDSMLTLRENMFLNGVKKTVSTIQSDETHGNR